MGRRILLLSLLFLLNAAKAESAQPEIPSVPMAAGELKPLAKIEGFRSARFGMDDAAIRKAILLDFGLHDEQIQVNLHPVEKTTVMSVTVDRLLPDTERAVVSYILGFHSQKLIQVNILWLQNKPDGLREAAMTLRNYFAKEQFPTGATASDVSLPDGSLLVFRGTDRQGHTVVVNYRMPEQKDKKEAAAGPGNDAYLLRVVYAERVQNPDVFVLEPGKF